MPKAQLKSGREKSVLRHHPWIFSGAISHADEGIDSGETVDVLDSKGAIIARGAYSPNSQIRIRVWTWDLSENIDADFIKRRINNAIAFRKRNLDLKLITSYRIIYGEVDGLPGFVVDRYDDILVVQCTTCGADRWRDIFIELICQLTGMKTIVERSDVDIRDLE